MNNCAPVLFYLYYIQCPVVPSRVVVLRVLAKIPSMVALFIFHASDWIRLHAKTCQDGIKKDIQ